MRKTTFTTLLQTAMAAWRSSLKRSALLSLGIILSLSNISAIQYCQHTLTNGASSIQVSMESPSTNNYVITIESAVTMTGIHDGWYIGASSGNFQAKTVAVLTNGGKTYTVAFTSTTAPNLYTNIHILYPGLVQYTWPASITWGQCLIAGIPTLAATTAASDITTSGATSGGNVTVEGNSPVTARGVCWSTATAPTVALATKTVDGAGTGSFTSSITGLSSGVKYYVRSYATNTEGTAYGAEVNFTTLDTEIPAAFTATKGTVGATTVELLLNATDNSGSITYSISYGAGPTIVSTTGTSGVQKSYIVTGLTESTAYTFSISAKDAANNAAANNPLEVSATTTSTVPTIAAPTPPVRVATDVLSIFSDAYTPVAGTRNYNPGWGQSGSASTIQVATNNTLKYTNLNYQGTIIGSNVNASAMTHLHVDIWSANETSLQFYLISTTAPTEKFVQLTPLVQNSWNSYDIPLASYTSQAGFSVASIKELKVVGSGGKIVCLDNIYFYKYVVPGDTEAPAAFTATKGAVTHNSVELLLNATDNSGFVDYTITYGASTLNVAGVSAVEKSYIVTGLTSETAYSFSVVAKDAALNPAGNNPLVVNATTLAPMAASPTPTPDAINVLSIYSDAYTPSATGHIYQSWWNASWEDAPLANAGIAKKVVSTNGGGGVGIEIAPLNVSAMTYLHVDVYPTTATAASNVLRYNVVPVGGGGAGWTSFQALTANQWNSVDILVSTLGLPGTSVFQVGFGTFAGEGTFYVDNIFFSKTISTATPNVKENKVKIYPNPAKDALNVSAQSEINAIRITNLVGQTIKNISVNAVERVIDLNNISNGQYIISLSMKNGEIVNQKFTKK